jgi:hypothetical protein
MLAVNWFSRLAVSCLFHSLVRSIMKRLALLSFSLHLLVATSASFAAELRIQPESIKLNGLLDRVQLVVFAEENGRTIDVTRLAKVESDSPNFKLTLTRQVVPFANHTGKISVTWNDQNAEVSVTITGCDQAAVISFEHDVIPVLSKAGCNQGACHASQYGKGEFKLSLFGFAPEKDHPQFVRAWQQRRVSFVQPEQSLILKKATLAVSHGGGQRFRTDSFEHELLLAWLNGGAVGPAKKSAHVVDLEVTPTERVYKVGESQQLNLIATYSDGIKRDVTHLAIYDSMGEGVASIDKHGLVEAIGPGQAPIMIRFQGQAKVSNVLVPRDQTVDLSKFTVKNSVDKLVKQHWQRLSLKPAEVCSDEVFLRRAFLDSIGTMPTKEKSAAFLASKAPDKHEQLVDELLGLTGDSKRDIYTSEWSAYWTLKWGDLLRNNRNKVGDGGMWAFHNWIRESLRSNKPVDQFVREIITAQGSIYANGPANYFKIATKAEDLAETTAQVFLGVRMQCCRCHHHPFEVYSQADYYGMAAFFTRVGTKASADFGAFGRDSIVMIKNSGSIKHPRTRKTMQPTPLLGKPVALDDVRDFRRPLADWLTSKENKMFSRNIVNRMWGYYMGTGLVESIDDMRATNPPSIPALLDGLAHDFAEGGFDLKQLMRSIMTSQVYQLSSTPLPENVADTRFYLHYNVKRLPAEVLLDAIDDACGTQERFTGVPLGTRAIELPDSNYASYFLDTLGRPKRVVACECERTGDPNLAQVLHILNGDLIQRKLTDKNGRIAKLIKAKTETDAAIQEMYLATFCRQPTQAELEHARKFLSTSKSMQMGYEDILWALMNSREFLFNH